MNPNAANPRPPDAPCGVCGAPIVSGVCRRCAFARALQGFNGGLSPRSDEGIGGRAETPDGFELLHEIGRGATATVWLAREQKLDRFVALKLIPLQIDPRLAQRLVREGQAVARLQHPHIVAVHSLGTAAHHAYLAMEFLEGGDLRDHLKRGVMFPSKATALMEKLAGALAHSHRNHVLHRDLKPSNVLLDGDGEPKLADFGLAAPLEGAGDLTLRGQVAGTAAYLAPELLEGAHRASEQSDVYSLGAVLYECLVGRAPFVGESAGAIFAQIAETDPPPPRLLQPGIPRDLETICLKCLQKYPVARYVSAEALRADLARFQRGDPIEAQAVSRATRAWYWARRNRSLAGLGAALALATVLGVGGIISQWRRAEHAATTNALNLYSADLKLASDALLVGNLGLARRTLESCPAEFRDAAWGLLFPFTRGDLESVIGRGRGTITDLALSPDGTFAATTAQADNVHVWNLSTHQAAGEFPDTAYAWWTAFSKEGTQLFTADRKVKQWDLATRTLLRDYPGASGALSPNGEILYTCEGRRFVFEGDSGPVAAWRIKDGSAVFRLSVRARVMASSPDGKLLAVSDAEENIALFDAKSGERRGKAWPSLGRLWSLEFSPDSTQLVASGWSNEVRVWTVDLGVEVPTVQVLKHPSGTWDASFSPDGATLAVGCSDSRVHQWEVKSWREISPLRGHTDEVWSLAWESNRTLLTGGRDWQLLRLGVDLKSDRTTLRHDRRPYSIVWLDAGRLMTVRQEETGMEAEMGSVRAHHQTVRFKGETPLAFDPRQQRLWLWTEQGELCARSGPTLAVARRMAVPLLAGEVLASVPHVAPDAGLAAVALTDQSLVVFRLGDGQRIARYEKVFAHPSEAAALSPDGAQFVWGGLSTELSILELKTGRRRSLKGHRYEVSSLVFSGDGRRFFSGGADGLIIVWDARTGDRIHELGQHATSVGALALSPDGKVLFSQEPGVGVHLWHPGTAREIGLLPLTGSMDAQWLGVSPDGQWLGVRQGDGAVRVVPLALPGGAEL